MSEPKRYGMAVNAENDFDLVEHPQGDFISYADYAALAADKEAETKAVFDAIRLITQLRDENAQLRDENKRLRQAGDAVVEDLEHLTKSGWFNKCKSVKAWHAAKERRGAK